MRGLLRRLGDGLLTLAAAGGVVCIVLVALSFFFDVSVLMFKTGSMEPTIRTGAVAIAYEIPAEAIEVGDVVSVSRPGQLPVTHRVLTVSEPGADAPAGAWTIEMKGDANESPDPAPYVVTEVDRVLFDIPHLARLVAALGNPYVLGSITLAAAALVTWAFWPKEERGSTASANGSGGGSEDDGTDAGGKADADGSGARNGAGARHVARAGLTAGVVVMGAGAALGVGPPGLGVTPVHAAQLGPDSAPQHHTTLFSGDSLHLMTIADPRAVGHMMVSDIEFWQVGVWADESEVVGTIDTSLEAEGNAEMGLDVTARVCTVPWEHEVCGGTEIPVPAPGHLSDDSSAPLIDGIPTDEERWFLFEVHIPQRIDPDHGDSLTLRVVAEGLGEYVTAGSPTPVPTTDPTDTPSSSDDGGAGATSAAGELPYTGSEILRLLGPAVGAIAFGLFVAFLAGVRRKR